MRLRSAPRIESDARRQTATVPGWSYSPSDSSERLPILARALLGFTIALYLSLCQLGLFADVWEPFFRDGTRIILHSSIARLLPVPDASLGAAAYLLPGPVLQRLQRRGSP